jgi:cyclopropane-fatty-acyl-phospholipid synthase
MSIHTISKAKTLTLRVLEELFGTGGKAPVSVRLWDDTTWPDGVARATTLVLKHPGALGAMFLPGHELGWAEAYLYDDFDVEGNLESLLDLGEDWVSVRSGWRMKLRAGGNLLRLPADGEHPWLKTHGRTLRRAPAKLSGQRHSVERDRQAIAFHYDVSNDFFALWLDQRMVYSCAYFRTPEEDLDTAQKNKLDYICRKLRLQPGQRLLDIGCGWGGLVIYAAQHYYVEATGITLSEPQAELASARIKAAGLENRCRVLVSDYRQVAEAATYDALVSVGMFEHVGETLLPAYFQHAHDLLKPGGVFLNHGIARRATDKAVAGPSFSDTYVFPDGELVPIDITLRAAEDAGFEVRDVESLREHYAMTLRHWVRRLEASHDAALRFVEEPTYRVWRLFMSGSANGFSRARLNLYQALIVKPDAHGSSGLPLTRADWYKKQERNTHDGIQE